MVYIFFVLCLMVTTSTYNKVKLSKEDSPRYWNGAEEIKVKKFKKRSKK